MKFKELLVAGLLEGKFVEPFSPSGKPNPNHPNFAKNKAKYDAEQKAEREANRPPKAAPKPKINLDKIFYDLSSIIGEFYPDGDPADYFPKYYRKHGIDYEIARKAFKKNGYKDEYDYIEQMKVDFPMTTEAAVADWDYGSHYNAGRAAALDDKAAATCPYKKGDVNAVLKRKAWLMGHKDHAPRKPKVSVPEGYGGDNTFNKSSRADWDPNMTDYKGDYGGSKNWGNREREDDERHDLDKWYLRVNGQVYSRFGKPVAWDSRALANQYGHTLQGEHPDWKILLTRSPV